MILDGVQNAPRFFVRRTRIGAERWTQNGQGAQNGQKAHRLGRNLEKPIRLVGYRLSQYHIMLVGFGYAY